MALLALVIAQALDTLTTILALRRPYTAEGSPLVAWLMRRGAWWPALKLALALAIPAAVWGLAGEAAGTACAWTIAALSAAAALNNARLIVRGGREDAAE